MEYGGALVALTLSPAEDVSPGAQAVASTVAARRALVRGRLMDRRYKPDASRR
jgi:hypothetical protein